MLILDNFTRKKCLSLINKNFLNDSSYLVDAEIDNNSELPWTSILFLVKLIQALIINMSTSETP